MLVVGLTGGVATGKSTVARMFKRCGAVVIDADQLARDIVRPGLPAWRAIVRTFGTGILKPGRTIDRHALGAIVFRNRAKLRRLERIVHPRVALEQQRLTRLAGRKNHKAVVIYDVPLLFEAGIDKRVDKTLVVTADQATQMARLKKRDGLSRAQALQRIRNQMPLAQKTRRADMILDGTRPRSFLYRQVRKLYRALRQAA